VDIDEKVSEILEQAAKRGLRLEFDRGVLCAKQAATADPEMGADMVKKIGPYLKHVYRHLRLRSTAARAQQLLGQRAWFQDRGEWVLGTLATAEDGALLGVSIDETEYRRSNTFTASPETLLIVMEEETASANGKEPSAKPRVGIFERLLFRRSTD
jgi:hypothetical protein